MINSITLTNFKQHENLTLDLASGFTVIRGANESGKSTILLALAYALFGTKALPDSLDDVVTWGAPVGTLRVDLSFSIDGVAYKVRRSKASCQLDYADQSVTGQVEVTNFIARLLKVDAGTAARLTIANQSAIRGALEAGTKATTDLIERLAEFDQIDNLIELMQEKLVLGNSANVTAAIAACSEELARAEATAVPVDEASAQSLIDEAEVAFTQAGGNLSECEKAQASAQEAHAKAREQVVRRDSLVRDVTRAQSVQRAAQEKLDAIVVPDAPADADAKVEELRKRIADAERADKVRAAYTTVQPYLKEPEEPTCKGTPASLEEDIRELANAEKASLTHLSDLRGHMKLLEARLTHGTCTFCGKDFSGVPEVEQRNARIREEIAETKRGIDSAAESSEARRETLVALQSIQRRQQDLLMAAAVGGDDVEIVEQGTLPQTLKWVGPAIGTPVDVGALKQQVRVLQDAVLSHQTAAIRRNDATRALEDAKAAVVEAQSVLGECPEAPMKATQEALDDARRATDTARSLAESARQVLYSQKRDLADRRSAYERAIADVKRSSERLGSLQAQLAELEFNNALLKRVRTCRPLLTDRLWTLVLAASSSYFSDIRGVKSRVTKTSEGFQIDGHPVSSMSGSTLDALGLAIRVALVRTFLPSSPFLVLDEPSSAMDGDRTGNMLGFLSKVGFSQIILVTHEDVSETVADHVITLGGTSY